MIVGQTFGRMTVVAIERAPDRRRFATCACECGNWARAGGDALEVKKAVEAAVAGAA